MKKLLLTLAILFSTTFVYAGDITRSHTYTNGEVLTHTNLNTSIDEIILEANDLDGDNLASNIAITTSGNAQFTGTFQATGTTIQIGDGADTLEIEATGGITYTGAQTWTFSASQTVSGTWANLGTVTTVDINGGTLDGMTIGASVAPTVTNLGTVTTADINGGTIDGTTIGGTTAAAGTFTTAEATTWSMNFNELQDVNSATATAGRIMVADGTDWESMLLTGDVTINTAGYVDIIAGTWILEKYDDINAIDLGAGDIDYTITLADRIQYRMLVQAYVISSDSARTLTTANLELTAAGTHSGYLIGHEINTATRTENNVVDAAAASITFWNDDEVDLAYSTTETVQIYLDVYFMKVATNVVTYRGCATFLETTTGNGPFYDECFQGITTDDDGVVDFYLTHSSAAEARVYGGRWIWKANTQ